MWWGKDTWWQRRAKENRGWCVICKLNFFPNTLVYHTRYVAVCKANAPSYAKAHVDNLTKEEAVAMAKMLNFVGE